jgi:hypothetical protein
LLPQHYNVQIKQRKLESKFQWSIVDRWPLHAGFIESVADRVLESLSEFDPADQHKVGHALEASFLHDCFCLVSHIVGNQGRMSGLVYLVHR